MGDVLVLWDVDGTLLNAGGVGGDLYEIVFSSLFGRPCEKLPPMAGRTDRAIILDTLEMAGIAEPRRHVDPFIEGLRAHAPRMFEAARRHGRALPGAAEALLAVASARVGTSTIGFPVRAAVVACPDCADDVLTPARGPATESPAEGQPAAGPGAADQEARPGAADPAADPWAGHEPEGGASEIPVSLIPAPARVAAETVAAGASVAAAGVPLGPPAEPQPGPAISQPGPARPQPGPAVLPLGVPVETALPAVSLPVTAPSVHVARRHPVSTAADLPSAHGRPRPQSWRVYQSVLTGNVRTLAEVKLSAVGLRHPLDLCIGAYGDDHEVRAELVHLARRRASAVHGRPVSDFSGQATVVIGDTPLDIKAALAAGARAVGVATGGYPAAVLHEAGAHAVLADLTNAAAVLSALLALPSGAPPAIPYPQEHRRRSLTLRSTVGDARQWLTCR